MGVAIAFLTGCSASSPTESTGAPVTTSSSAPDQAKVDRACSAATDFTESLTNFSNLLTPEVTIDQLRAGGKDVARSYEALERAAEDIAEDRMAAVIAAERKFQAAVNDIRDQATVPEAIESLRNEAAEVQTAVSGLTEEVEC